MTPHPLGRPQRRQEPLRRAPDAEGVSALPDLDEGLLFGRAGWIRRQWL